MLSPAAGVSNFEAQTTGRTNQGDLWNDSSQKGLSSFLGSMQQQLSSVVFVATASAGPSNTNSETSLLGTGVGSKTLPANFLVPGKMIRVRGSGVFNSLASPGNLTLKLKLGSTVLGSATFTPPVSGSNNAFSYDVIFTCRTAGGSGSVMPEGRFTLANYSGATATGSRVSGDLNNLSAAVTVDTTISQVLDVTATFATGSASNVMTGASSIIEVLN